MNPSLEKTKFSHILLLKLSNIIYESECYLKYLEAN